MDLHFDCIATQKYKDRENTPILYMESSYLQTQSFSDTIKVDDVFKNYIIWCRNTSSFFIEKDFFINAVCKMYHIRAIGKVNHFVKLISSNVII